jgi:dipeptidyl aminopeptidase/acylaminoacyl peptidase
MTKTILLAAAAAALPLAAIPALAQGQVPLIARDKFFGNPTKTAGRLSPDGKWLSWIAPRDGVLNIYVAPASNPAAAKPLTNERQRPIRSYFWSPDSKQILFINDKGGDENFLLYGVDAVTAEQRALTPFEKTRVQVINISNDVKDRILIGVNNRDPRWHDVHSLDLKSGKLSPVLENKDGYAGFLADEQLVVRVATKSRSDGGSSFYRVVNNKVEAKPFEEVTLEDAQTTQPVGFTSDGTTMYWIDSRGRDTAALVAQDVASGRKTVVAQNAKADIGGALTNPKTGRVEAYAANYLKNEWTPLDNAVRADLAFLQKNLKGEIAVTSRTDADDKWIVAVDPVTAPSTTYLYDRRKKALTSSTSRGPSSKGRRSRRCIHRDQDARRDEHGLLPDAAARRRSRRRRPPRQAGADGPARPWRPVGARRLRL